MKSAPLLFTWGLPRAEAAFIVAHKGVLPWRQRIVIGCPDPLERHRRRAQPGQESHRHLSNLIGICPFNLVTMDGGEADRRTIRASLEQWDELGTGGWCGYSFSWMAALPARVGDADPVVIRKSAATTLNKLPLYGESP